MAFPERAIVVGASSGIGLAIAEELARRGTRVALLARRQDLLEAARERIGGDRAWIYPHDVRDIAAIPALFQQIAHDLGGLDLVVYASGIASNARMGTFDTAQDADTIAVNVTGAIAWLNEAATRFGQMRSGAIVAISSVAGERGRRSGPSYGASKAALTSYMESLRNLLAVKGVTVLCVKPGFVATDMLKGSRLPPGIPVATPDAAARQICHAIAARREVIYVPRFWRGVAWLLRAMPSAVMKRVNA